MLSGIRLKSTTFNQLGAAVAKRLAVERRVTLWNGNVTEPLPDKAALNIVVKRELTPIDEQNNNN